MKINYAMVFVSDMDEAVGFYRDVVGLKLKFQTPGWSEFLTEGATLALHPTTHPALDSNPSHKAAGTMRLGFSVGDIEAFHVRMVEAKVSCLQPPTEQHGVKLAQYQGPDGIVFSIGESRES